MKFETDRLLLRELTEDDFPALCAILCDGETMYAYEGAFTVEEARNWLNRQFSNYQTLGFGLWAVVLKETGAMIGQCGLTMQDCKDRKVLEIGYLFQKEYWRRGYASEAAAACKEHAFRLLHADEVFSIIRDTNAASQGVARRNGMVPVDSFVKHYRGVDMPHVVFSVKNPERPTGEGA